MNNNSDQHLNESSIEMHLNPCKLTFVHDCYNVMSSPSNQSILLCDLNIPLTSISTYLNITFNLPLQLCPLCPIALLHVCKNILELLIAHNASNIM